MNPCSLSIITELVSVLNWENTPCWPPVHNVELGMEELYMLIIELFLWIFSCDMIVLFQHSFSKTVSKTLKKEVGVGREEPNQLLCIYVLSRLKPLYALFSFAGPILLGWCTDSKQNNRCLPVPKVQWDYCGKILPCLPKYLWK